MKHNQQKSLEDVIKDLHKKYKNAPSPLSESNRHFQPNIVPPQKIGGDNRQSLLGDFRPTPKTW
jgi:hypothetical protein